MMDNPGNIQIESYNYDLPDNRIAKFPKSLRDSSKLLFWKNGDISEDTFSNIDEYLPSNTMLYFNKTRVVQARLLFKKITGASIEIFCLEPLSPTTEIQLAFEQRGWAEWRCFVGNARRWKSGEILCKTDTLKISAQCVGREDNAFIIRFEWEPKEMSFSEILLEVGKIPLPPYLNRDAEESDKKTYQTVYARVEGSVAAPTAGLHFTDSVFSKLQKKGIQKQEVVLHVGAGTFKPVDSELVSGHKMHVERVILSRENIESLLLKNIYRVVVGTTSVRTLESLYWYGVKLIVDGDQDFVVNQWDPYCDKYCLPNFSLEEVVNVILEKMTHDNLSFLSGETSLMIGPGYIYRILDGIITNFHQPKSTLLLLVSAFLGEDWKKVYDYALDHDFRFLSYGDSCLFLK